MVRSFSLALLITSVFITFSCKSVYILSGSDAQNISVSVNEAEIDSQIVKMYLPYKTVIDKDMKRVISYSESEMVKAKPESGLTNLLADLLLDEGKKLTLNNKIPLNPDVSYVNNGGVRTSLPQGDITVGKIFELMPFENELVFIQLTGEQLQEFYNNLAEKGGEGVGGVRFVISNGKAKNIMINGEMLDSQKTYWMATNDYSANGGDGLAVLTKRLQFINSGKKIRDVIISDFEERQKEGIILTSKTDGRITNE